MVNVAVIHADEPRDGKYGRYQILYFDDGADYASVFYNDNGYQPFPVQSGDEVKLTQKSYDARKVAYVGPHAVIDAGNVFEKSWGKSQFVKVKLPSGERVKFFHAPKHATVTGDEFPVTNGMEVHVPKYQFDKPENHEKAPQTARKQTNVDSFVKRGKYDDEIHAFFGGDD